MEVNAMLTREDLMEAEIIAELAGTIPPEDLQKIIDAHATYHALNEPGFFEKMGRWMCGGGE